MAYLSMTAPDVYAQAIRSGLALWYTVDASRAGVPVAGATGLRPTGGTITDTTKPGVRRVLNLELPGERDLFDALSPIGTTLTVTAHVRYTDRTVVDIPMGVFDVDSEKITEGGGSLSLTAPDKWVRIQRARFLWPTGPLVGTSVTNQIVGLIRDALGPSEPVNVTATSTATVGALVWEKDRDKAIMDLAESIGAWVYFDRHGVATIADLPTIGVSADWLLDASAQGVLTELSRERSRAGTANVVVVSSSAADGAAFGTEYVWDYDPASPTYAGTDPSTAANVGPFGIVAYFYDTPLPLSQAAARKTGETILARTTGLASSVSLGAVPNPAMDAFDVIDVLPPAERVTTVEFISTPGGGGLYPAGDLMPSSSLFPDAGKTRTKLTRNTTGAALERHICDNITHPLAVGAAQSIDGRSTRTDPYQ